MGGVIRHVFFFLFSSIYHEKCKSTIWYMQLGLYPWLKECGMYEYMEHLYNIEMIRVLAKIEEKILNSVG